MKRLLFALTLSVISLSCLAQEKQLMKEALDNGINSYGYYHIENTKNRSTNLSKMASYIRNAGYIPLDGGDKYARRFGDVNSVLDYYDFTDREHYQGYVFSALSGLPSDTYGELKNNGTFYSIEQGTYKERESDGWLSTVKYAKLTRNDNAQWSGNIKDGLIDGTGHGLVTLDNGMIMWFKGTFESGIPASLAVHTKSVKRNGDGIIKKDIVTSGFGRLTTKGIAENLLNADAQLKQAIYSHLSIHYQENIKKIDAAYEKIRSITISNYGDYSPDDEVQAFFDCYENAGYDPQNYVGKAREILKVYQILPALNLQFRDKYYGVSLFSLLSSTYDWYSTDEKTDRACLSEGLEAATWGKNNSRYGLKNFFSQAYTSLQKKNNQFNNKINSDRAEFRRTNDRLAAESKRRQSEFLAKHGHEVNWDGSKEPSGELISSSGLIASLLGSGTYQYYNDGVIKLKNGKSYDYNIIFDDRKRFKCFTVRSSLNGSYNNTFKTRDEMIDAIVRDNR